MSSQAYTIKRRKTFACSGENPTGERNGGARTQALEKLDAWTRILPGDTLTLVDMDGPGMLTHMWITVGEYQRACILRIYYDHNDYPSVEAPLSAFFGYAYDSNQYDREGKYITLNCSKLLVAPCKGFNSYWEIPFKKHVKVTLENRDYQDQIAFYTITGWLGELDDDTGYFHAEYRMEHPVTKGVPYTVLDGVEGRGRFAGVTLAVGLNGNTTTWVEGETKMYIDGEQYPSINYTAVEDYFCACCNYGIDAGGPNPHYETYNGLYVGLNAIIGGDNDRNQQQRFLLYRIHDPDPIYFDESFRFTIDNLGVTGTRYDDFSSVAYYYLTEPKPLTSVLPDHLALEDRPWAYIKYVRYYSLKAIAKVESEISSLEGKVSPSILAPILEEIANQKNIIPTSLSISTMRADVDKIVKAVEDIKQNI